ncbi:hypothetical protein EYZ11_013467 [Aspergillus tanneri]|uniref:Uncharacterized protein n=1 Tax=Aspergillus tanneri TaxID=1220188 RepID=A0A4S3IXL2_9EURO|nr:hypothetical protein EYZ11_013467 [Aspergillus tanneri]
MQFPWDYGTGLKLARDPESRPNECYIALLATFDFTHCARICFWDDRLYSINKGARSSRMSFVQG